VDASRRALARRSPAGRPAADAERTVAWRLGARAIAEKARDRLDPTRPVPYLSPPVLRLASPSLAVLVAALTITSAASAVVTPPRAGEAGLRAVTGEPLRRAPAIAWDRAPDARREAWARFVAEAGSAWHVAWDLDTLVPSRVVGEGLAAPGASRDPRAAEAHARAFLERHLALFAPGSTAADLVLATNEVAGGQRFVAFALTTRAAGLRVPVVGGQLGVRYRADRLVLVASEAAPLGGLRGELRVSAEAARHAATAVVSGAAKASSSELVVLPLVRPESVTVRLAHRVRVEADRPRAKADVFVDAETGDVLATDSLLRWAGGTIAFDAPIRGPNDLRKEYPAPWLDVVVDGTEAVATEAGAIEFAAPGPASVNVGAIGTYVGIANFAGDPITGTLSVADGATTTWSNASDEPLDAQLSGYVHANIAKAHARVVAGEDMGTWLDQRLTVNVNRPDIYGCNAFWDGEALNFLRESGQCNNSARVADVVYHEFGHGFHQHSVKKGSGSVDPAVGEGSGDFYAASITGDPEIGPGFFLGGGSIRAIDGGLRWPTDIANDPHETGLIWAGAMWDLRQAMQKKEGDAAGAHRTDVLFHAILGGATNIPSTYAEALAADDDDGDLANGTPHICQINEAFSKHGLGHILNAAGLSLSHDQLARLPSSKEPYPIAVKAKVLYPECAGAAAVDGIAVSWTRPVGLPGSATLEPDGDDFKGSIDGQKGPTALTYHLTATLGDLSYDLPDNPADPDYQAFVGEVEELYCNDFEHDVDGWKLGNGGSNDFEWGSPTGQGGDPPKAFSGSKAIGDKLGGDGLYKVGRKASATSPVIDVKGKPNLRLQFRRWLTVEDGALDQATIYVNGNQVWQNAGTDENTASMEHVDREWRFVDLDLAGYVQPSDDTVQVRFELKSGPRGVRGGWNVDDLCVVSAKKAPPVVAADAGADDGGAGGAAPASAEADTSSGCAVGARGRAEGGLAVAIALAALAARRRRRRA
jgi:hypothetical protein